MSNYISTPHFLRCLREAEMTGGVRIFRMCNILKSLVADNPNPEKGVTFMVEFHHISVLPMPVVLRGMVHEYNTARFRRVRRYLFSGAPARCINEPYHYPHDVNLIIALGFSLLDMLKPSEE
ncbi:hypothetical protein KQX54_012873 [Cotesia glomerata]|uniref:Uncharacterized protein n=1 Tax=Cotesia glomerata TaxID=32391 RepID=A0AAV7HYE8_COTGL|nr:hypothetical protein KQX54_012873 [Cotesia glomerata]